ncbi:MAG: helix-turn-helix domain-containing protein [Bacteroidetes bacterium]|nr:helix-turn-helix domain-containing protein [Bacteroidota bacterium]MCL6102982.1 helix-turn-helix domain-containing protein [Bacteroidota bacterium]
MKELSFEEVKNLRIGTIGTPARDKYELETESIILAAKIKQVRKQKGMNQDELGVLIGVKKSQISKIETNPQDMKLSTIMRIVKALNMEVVLESGGIKVKSVLV